MKGIIFDIQNYAIYDGPGIRTLIFLKGCPLRCLWCQNPESQKLNPQISYFKEKCLLCETCIKTCPNNALSLNVDEIIRNENLCVLCGNCVEACPNQVLEIIGKEYSIEELVEIALRDKPFYDNSGGGVTISGGEPTMQFKFLIQLLKQLKNNGIHVAVETCGYFNESLIEDLTDNVDLFLFDIKHPDDEKHKNFTGVCNDIILTNFSKIHSKVGNERIVPRIPLIPTVNTDEKTIMNIISFLQQINYQGIIHLMPYNKLANTKYEKVGMGKLYKDMGDLTEDDIKNIVDIFERHLFQVIINY
ncbi:MAG: glycyl-radical enzyme activating protein [Promethearchaeota archaeon]